MAIYEGNCEHCGTPYRVSRVESQGKPRFCSRACYEATRGGRPPITKSCERCGQPFVTKAATADRMRFCSYECYWATGVHNHRPRTVEPRYERVYLGKDEAGRRRYMQRSHVVWNQAHPDDPVRPGEEIHHIDGNRLNDVPENLLKVTREEHQRLHPDRPIYHERRERALAHHAANPGKQRRGEPKSCPVCGVEFYRPPSAKAVTCSYACAHAYRRLKQP